MARLLSGAIVAPRGRMRRRRSLGIVLAAPLLLLLLLLLAVAPFGASPIDENAATDENNENPRNRFERSYFQLPAQHLREAARADLGGVEFDGGLYRDGETTTRGERTRKKKKGVEEASSTSSTSSSSAAAAAAPHQQDLVKVMLVQPDAQQMEAIMRGEQVK